MAQKLRPFGESEGSVSPFANGYTLPLLVGHLEGLISDEEDKVKSAGGPRRERLTLVQDALPLLIRAMEMGGEEY